MSDPRHPFDVAVDLQPLSMGLSSSGSEVGHWRGQAHPGYQNMVGPFGGMTAAQALQAVCQHPHRLGEPVALTVNFVAAVDAARPFALEAVPVRTNRSTQHWTLCMTQTSPDGRVEVVLTGTALTALRRTTWSAVDAAMPAVPSPLAVERLRIANQMEWLHRYEFRLCAGNLPIQWDGSEADSLSRLWMRDDPPRPLDFLSLTALADAFFPRVWRRRARLTPAGTVSMTVYFHADTAVLEAAGTEYVLGQAQAQSFFNGYFDQHAALWSQSGHLLATTHQMVYFKE